MALAGALLVWPIVFDSVFIFLRPLRRLRNREDVFAAHRSHLYQRLVIAGYSHRAVTLLYIGLAAAGVLLSALWCSGGLIGDLAVIVVFLIN